MERNKPTVWAAHSTIHLEPSHTRIPDGGGWSGPQKGLFIPLVVLHHHTNTSVAAGQCCKAFSYLLLSRHFLGPVILGEEVAGACG